MSPKTLKRQHRKIPDRHTVLFGSAGSGKTYAFAAVKPMTQYWGRRGLGRVDPIQYSIDDPSSNLLIISQVEDYLAAETFGRRAVEAKRSLQLYDLVNQAWGSVRAGPQQQGAAPKRTARRRAPVTRKLDSALAALHLIIVEHKRDVTTWVSAARALDAAAAEEDAKYPRRAELATAVADALAFTPPDDISDSGLQPLRHAYKALRRGFIAQAEEDQIMSGFFRHRWTVDAVLEETDLASLLAVESDEHSSS
jgi:hypothetical protein